MSMEKPGRKRSAAGIVVAVALLSTVVDGFLPTVCHPSGAAILRRHALFSADRTTLPDSFDEGVESAVQSTARALEDGWTRLRVDFDTTAGDETYTTLKSSFVLSQKFSQKLSDFFVPPREGDGVEDSEEDTRTVRLYFPDAGSAALAKRDWRFGEPDALVPPCVRFSSLGRERPAPTDQALIMICPRASESDAVREILEQVQPESTPIIFINPELVNMGVTGYGAAGRWLRQAVLDKLMYSFYLRTSDWGAVTRAYPRSFSVYTLDVEQGGQSYKYEQTTEFMPSAEALDEIAESVYKLSEGTDEQKAPGFVRKIADFIEKFGQL